MIILLRNKNICCGLKKVVAKSRVRVYSEQQILALLLVFHQAHNLSRNKCARVQANQPISALHFFNPQRKHLLRVKLIMQGEKRDTSTKTSNETMRVFVSRLSPPLDSNDQNQAADQRFSLKQWFAGGAQSRGLRKPGCGHCYLSFFT